MASVDMLRPEMPRDPEPTDPIRPTTDPRPALLAALLLAVPIVAVAALAALAAGAADAPIAPSPIAANDSLAGLLPPAVLDALESLRDIPRVVFFGALIVATWLPFPVGLFYVAAGILYGVPFALGGIAVSLIASNLILHFVSNRFLRPQIERLVARRGHSVPSFDSPLDESLFIGLIRLTPGIPYFLQNAILAAAKVDLLRFVVLSVAIQMIYVTGFVVLGRSAFEGELGWALAALALFVALTAGLRFFVRRRAR